MAAVALPLRLSVVTSASGRPQLPPVTPVLLCFYVAWLVMEARPPLTTYDSVSAYVTALVNWCKIRGRPNPRLDAILGGTDGGFFSLCRGLKRHMGKAPPTRYPVTEWHLAKLFAAASDLLPLHQRLNFQAAARLAYSALLRVSEFTTAGVLDPLRNPQRRDVRFVPNLEGLLYVAFTIKQSKTGL